jgi:uncharacterized damage-inducible protein DinB
MSSERAHLINAIRNLPDQLEALVANLSVEELTTPYLANEWTVAQNVHHLFDSHANSYIRCKLIATEERPTLKPYDQDAWATLPDAQQADISGSLALLRNLHARWVHFWQSLPDAAWQRVGYHPEHGEMSLDQIVRIYAEHGVAHLDQITRTLAAR